MENKLVIYPKTIPLSPPELISQRNHSNGSIRIGHKKSAPTGSPEESEELARIYDELKTKLSIPRIDRLSGRSLGEWDAERNAVKVLQKEGKFNIFGYSLNGEIFLEPYEALFLLELNRIDICYFSMTMSIEQGYLLLLGEKENSNYKNYLVYSLFSRIGYIVQKHQNIVFSEKPPSIEDCIWSLLYNCVQKTPIPERVRNSEYFLKVERSMSDIREKIIHQQYQHQDTIPNDHCDANLFKGKIKPIGKRKIDTYDSGQQKKSRYEFICEEQKSFIDMLTKEEEYKRFEQIFQSLHVIKLKPQFAYDETDSEGEELEIQFDVHLHSDNFRKSEPKIPTFRLAVLANDQIFPSRSVISKCYHKQQHKVPVLVTSVSESKNIQAFLYYFT